MARLTRDHRDLLARKLERDGQVAGLRKELAEAAAAAAASQVGRALRRQVPHTFTELERVQRHYFRVGGIFREDGRWLTGSWETFPRTMGDRQRGINPTGERVPKSFDDSPTH